MSGKERTYGQCVSPPDVAADKYRYLRYLPRLGGDNCLLGVGLYCTAWCFVLGK